jgi:outer membrane receptor for ferrienterochelin and colicins
VITYKYYPWWSLRAGGGITGRYNSLSDVEEQDKKFYYSPDAVFTSSYRWLKYDVDFTLDYKFTGEMPQFFIIGEQVYEGYISAYNTMDFTVQKSFFKNRLTIGTGVKNIFDNTTIPAVGEGGVHSGGSGSTPIGWGRTIFLQAAVNFNKF